MTNSTERVERERERERERENLAARNVHGVRWKKGSRGSAAE